MRSPSELVLDRLKAEKTTKFNIPYDAVGKRHDQTPVAGISSERGKTSSRKRTSRFRFFKEADESDATFESPGKHSKPRD